MLGTENRKRGPDDRGDNPAADIVGNVPERPHATALPAREPVSDSDKRGADAHPLKQAVEDHQRSEDPECGAEPQANVDDSAQHQAAGHKDFRTGFIRQAAHDAFAYPIRNEHTAAEQTDLRGAKI